MQSEFLFLSESVSEGHPDKLCDQISDAVVGRFLLQDPGARVAAECAVSTGIVFLSIKFLSSATVNVADTARDVIREVGYRNGNFNPAQCTVMTSLHELPGPSARPGGDGPAIETGEILAAEQPATLFGFACTETADLMPMPIALAHALTKRLDAARAADLAYLAPDAKLQVGVEYRDRRPRRIHSIGVVASQWDPQYPAPARLTKDLIEGVLEPALENEALTLDADTVISVNPEGPIAEGGPAFHAGLTGRKGGDDTYGDFSRQSSAALSGKDPHRVDRIGAYAARHAAKNVVAAGLSEECEVQLSYTVGATAPVSVRVDTFGTGRVEEAEIARRLSEAFDFRVAAIASRFRLHELARRYGPEFFRRLSAHGHVGRSDLPLPWEDTSEAAALR